MQNIWLENRVMYKTLVLVKQSINSNGLNVLKLGKFSTVTINSMYTVPSWMLKSGI